MAEGIDTAMKLFTSGKPEATSKQITKWFTDAKVVTKKNKNCSSNNLDIAFTKVKAKGAKVLKANEVPALIKEVAKAYAKDNKDMSEDEAVTQITAKLGSAKPDLAGTTKQSATGGVGRMTDASKYTGLHKERFDESGKGKGIEGREDRPDKSGYVGNYKGDGTYDASH